MVNQYCAHFFARNWQLSFLNQQKGENDHRKYFMVNLHERFPTWWESNPQPPDQWSPVGCASNWATVAGSMSFWTKDFLTHFYFNNACQLGKIVCISANQWSRTKISKSVFEINLKLHYFKEMMLWYFTSLFFSHYLSLSRQWKGSVQCSALESWAEFCL